MSRGDRREPIFEDDPDRRRFLETLAQVCAKTSWQVHAYCCLIQAGWTEEELPARPKGDPVKLAVACRLRQETTVTLKWIQPAAGNGGVDAPQPASLRAAEGRGKETKLKKLGTDPLLLLLDRQSVSRGLPVLH